MSLLFKLFARNVRWWQVAGFALANLVGAVIVLVGVQCYGDVDRMLNGDDSIIKSSYIVISKPVNTLSSIGSLVNGASEKPKFSESEIAELEKIDGVSSVGRFTASQFRVVGRVDIMGAGFSTDMFLESVPDEFLDLKPDVRWRVTEDDDVLPILLPSNYLSLYNYGFASATNQPQMSEKMVTSVKFDLIFSGPGGRKAYKARIIGFTNRLNTILVPDAFLKQQNSEIALAGDELQGMIDSDIQSEAAAPRLILNVDASAGNKKLMQYIEDKDYQVEGPDEKSMRLQTVVHGILYAVVGIGLLVSLLSFFLLLISILLLIEKNREKFTNLYSLGYDVRMISRPYQLLAVGVNVVVWAVALLVSNLVYSQFEGVFRLANEHYAEANGSWTMVVAAALLCVFFSLLHWVSVYSNTKKICLVGVIR